MSSLKQNILMRESVVGRDNNARRQYNRMLSQNNVPALRGGARWFNPLTWLSLLPFVGAASDEDGSELSTEVMSSDVSTIYSDGALSSLPYDSRENASFMSTMLDENMSVPSFESPAASIVIDRALDGEFVKHVSNEIQEELTSVARKNAVFQYFDDAIQKEIVDKVNDAVVNYFRRMYSAMAEQVQSEIDIINEKFDAIYYGDRARYDLENMDVQRSEELAQATKDRILYFVYTDEFRLLVNEAIATILTVLISLEGFRRLVNQLRIKITEIIEYATIKNIEEEALRDTM